MAVKWKQAYFLGNCIFFFSILRAEKVDIFSPDLAQVKENE
jgi:hypothetical protein